VYVFGGGEGGGGGLLWVVVLSVSAFCVPILDQLANLREI
jgi:hypothetical protein